MFDIFELFVEFFRDLFTAYNSFLVNLIGLDLTVYSIDTIFVEANLLQLLVFGLSIFVIFMIFYLTYRFIAYIFSFGVMKKRKK